MSSFKWSTIKRHTNGAVHPSGEPWYCIRCSINGAARRKQATVTARIIYNGFRLPVAYCHIHIPRELEETL